MSTSGKERDVIAPNSVLDRKAFRHAFDRAADAGGDERVVAAEIARRMEERLDFVRLDPRRILDAGCGNAHVGRLLAKRYPLARVIGLDISLSALRASRRNEPLRVRALSVLGFGTGGSQMICGNLEAVPLPDASVDMVWSNLALAWTQDTGQVFREIHRVLRDGGLLMFSSYGPDTLRELRAAFAAVDRLPHVHDFADMHDLGDMLLSSGFAEPVMDMEKLVYTYADVEPMIRELRLSGQTNAKRDRRRGLTGLSVWKAMCSAYPRREVDGRIETTFEIVYGHAWKVGQKPRRAGTVNGSEKVQWLPPRNNKS